MNKIIIALIMLIMSAGLRASAEDIPVGIWKMEITDREKKAKIVSRTATITNDKFSVKMDYDDPNSKSVEMTWNLKVKEDGIYLETEGNEQKISVKIVGDDAIVFDMGLGRPERMTKITEKKE